VTFAIPAFAVFYGALLLDEAITSWMVACALVIMLGTTLSTGLWTPGKSVLPQSS
jgi:drug/metabolite transporter (DMT)-like permease